MLDGTLLAVAIICGWLCRSCLLERATLGRPKRVEQPAPQFWGLLAGLVVVTNYAELNRNRFENGAADVLTTTVGIFGTWLLAVSASVHAALLKHASKMDVHKLGTFWIPVAWLLGVALPSAALRRVFRVKGNTPLNAPTMTQPPTSVQRLKSSLGYQLWALLVWVPLCWVVIIPATTAIDNVLRGMEGSSVSNLFATFPLLVILKHWTGLAIVLRIDFLVSLQVVRLLSRLLLKVPSLIDVLVTCMAKHSLMAYRALATPLCASIGLCEIFAVAYHVWSTGALVCLDRYSYVYPLVLPYLVATWLLFLLGWCDALIRRTFNLDGVPGRYVGVRPQPVFARRLTSLVYEELALLPLWTCGLSAVLLLLLIGLSAEENINLATINMVLRLFTADKRRAVPVRMASAGLLLRAMVLLAQLMVRTLSTATHMIYTSCFRVDPLGAGRVVFLADTPAPSAAGDLIGETRGTAPQPKRGWLLRLTLWSLPIMGSMAYATMESMLLFCCVGIMLVVYYHVPRLAVWLLTVPRLWVVDVEGLWMGLALLPCGWLAIAGLACAAYVANLMRISGVRACMCIAHRIRVGCARVYRSFAARRTPTTTATDMAPLFLSRGSDSPAAASLELRSSSTTTIEADVQDTQLVALVGPRNTGRSGNNKVLTALLSGFKLPTHDQPLCEHDIEHDMTDTTSLSRVQELADGFRQPLPRSEKRRRSTNGQLLIGLEGEDIEEGTGQDWAAEQRAEQNGKNAYKAGKTQHDQRRAAARLAKTQSQAMPDNDDDDTPAAGIDTGVRNIVSKAPSHVRGSGSGKARHPAWIDDVRDHPRTSPCSKAQVHKMAASVNGFEQLGSLTFAKAPEATVDSAVRTEVMQAVHEVAMSVSGDKVMDAPGQPLVQLNADTQEAGPEAEANLRSAKKDKKGRKGGKGGKGKKTEDAVDRRISTSQGAEGAAASLIELVTPVTGVAQDGDNVQRDARIAALEGQVKDLTQVVLLLLKQQEESVATRLAGLHAEQDMLKVVAGLVSKLQV